MSPPDPNDLVVKSKGRSRLESSSALEPLSNGIVDSDRSTTLRAESASPHILDPSVAQNYDQARSDFIHHRLFAVGDLLALIVAATIAGALTLIGDHNLDLIYFAATVAAVAPAWFLAAYIAGLYHDFSRQIDQVYVDELTKIAMVATIWCWVFVIVRSLILDDGTDLLTPVILWASMIPLLLVSRSFVRSAARRRSWNVRSVAVIGDSNGLASIEKRIARHEEWGLQVRLEVALEDDRFSVHGKRSTDGQIPGNSFSTVIKLGVAERSEAQQITDVIEASKVDRVLIAGGSRDLMNRTKLVHELVDRGITVDQITGGPETLYSSAMLQHLEGITVMTVSPSGSQPVGSFLKRVIDVSVSLTGLILLSPILLAAAVAIKMGDRGTVFFRQLREGKDGKSFQILKLRTMVDGADRERKNLRNEGMHSESGGMLKLKKDPRITKTGKFLRNTSIDEIPQLWNVLVGDMSLVGPRPLPLDEACQIEDGFSARKRVRPGITGPWQVMGRSDIPMEDMVKLDYTYVVGWTLIEDFRVLLRTASAVFGRKGVY